MDRQIERPTLQPPFDPSVDLLCHPCITKANRFYRCPILETSATALCGSSLYLWKIRCVNPQLVYHGTLTNQISGMGWYLSWLKVSFSHWSIHRGVPAHNLWFSPDWGSIIYTLVGFKDFRDINPDSWIDDHSSIQLYNPAFTISHVIQEPSSWITNIMIISHLYDGLWFLPNISKISKEQLNLWRPIQPASLLLYLAMSLLANCGSDVSSADPTGHWRNRWAASCAAGAIGLMVSPWSHEHQYP